MRLKFLSTGDIDITVMKSFCRWSNLIRLLESPHCPVALKEEWEQVKDQLRPGNLAEDFASDDKPNEYAFNSHRRGAKTAPLDLDILNSLKRALHYRFGEASTTIRRMPNLGEAVFLKYHRRDHILFTNFRTNLVHSLIYFRTSLDKKGGELVPGQIREIFEVHRIDEGKLLVESFAAVHRYERVQLSASEDPFFSFPDFRASIYHRHPIADVEVIWASQLYCHANQREWDNSSVVMRAIDRVRVPPNRDDKCSDRADYIICQSY